jgi:hypothetical protein
MKKRWVVFALVAVGLSVPAMRVAAETDPPAALTWSGQLIAFDVDARSITLRAPVRGDQAQAELQEYVAGDQILLTWSGSGTRADAISGATRFDPASHRIQPLTVPAEFVKYEVKTQLLTFIVVAPDADFATLKTLRPGEWVTSTGGSRNAEGVRQVAPFTQCQAGSEAAC